MRFAAPQKLEGERGLFWHDSLPLPSDQIAPDQAVVGSLSIDENGHTRLSLDGRLPHALEREKAARMEETGEAPGRVHGFLISDNRRVILDGIHRGGITRRYPGVDSDVVIASNTLLAEETGHQRGYNFTGDVSAINIPLRGFEDWLYLDTISATTRKTTRSFSYSPREPERHDALGAKWTYFSSLRESPNTRHPRWEVHVIDVPEITSRFTADTGLADCKLLVGALEEFFILMTGAERSFDWPTVRFGSGDGSSQWTLFYLRSKLRQDEATRFRCWVPLPALGDQFLAAADRWYRLRSRLGSAAYSYLATRRKSKELYAEHHLISLIWGLESLSRKLEVGEISRSENRRLDRILEDTKQASDRSWLEKKLKAVREPSLERRLLAIFRSLPPVFEAGSLERFALKLAKVRNSLSHTGASEPQDGKSQTATITMMAHALGRLYHAKLLQLIQIPDEVISDALTKSFIGNEAQFYLRQVGLGALPYDHEK